MSLLVLSPVPLAVLPAVSSALIDAVIGPSARPERSTGSCRCPARSPPHPDDAVGERHRGGGVGVDAGNRVAAAPCSQLLRSRRRR